MQAGAEDKSRRDLKAGHPFVQSSFTRCWTMQQFALETGSQAIPVPGSRLPQQGCPATRA